MRRRGLLAGTAIAAALVLAAPGADAGVSVVETFDTAGPMARYGSGASVDCSAATGEAGCSLLLAPTGASFTGARASLNAPISQRTVIRFSFFNDPGSWDIDADFFVSLDNGGYIQLHLTQGAGAFNRALSLYTPLGRLEWFDSALVAGVWEKLDIDIDPSSRTVTALRAGGTPGQLGYPAASTRVTGVDARAVRWGGGTHVRFDNVVVASAP